jgi:RNA recognition motif-containing protein
LAVRLFVGNLSYGTTETDLRPYFGAVAPPSQIVLPVDRETGRPRGFAFVEFIDRAHAVEAIQRFNGQIFNGRPLAVSEARARDDRGPSAPRPGGPPGPRPGGSGFSPRPPYSFGGPRPFDSSGAPAPAGRSPISADAKPRAADRKPRRRTPSARAVPYRSRPPADPSRSTTTRRTSPCRISTTSRRASLKTKRKKKKKTKSRELRRPSHRPPTCV